MTHVSDLDAMLPKSYFLPFEFGTTLLEMYLIKHVGCSEQIMSISPDLSPCNHAQMINERPLSTLMASLS